MTPLEATVHRISAGAGTLSGAVTTAVAGDTLLLVTSGGHYYESVQLTLPSYPLVMMADSTLSDMPIVVVDDDRMLIPTHDFWVRGVHFDGRGKTAYAIRSQAAQPNRIFIEQCVFSGFTKDAVTDGDRPVAHCEVRHSVFRDIDATAIEFRTEDMCANLVVDACTFYRLGEHAVHITEKTLPVRVRISRVTIYDAMGGIYLNGVGDGQVTNSIVTHCRVYGIRSFLPTLLQDICLYGNRTDFSVVAGGSGCIHADPQFYDPEAGDFSLLPESPCLESNGNGLGDPRWIGAATIRAGRLYRLFRISWWLGGLVLVLGTFYGGFWVVRFCVRRQEEHKAAVVLRESEAKYRDLFDSAYDVILIVNAQGDILEINRRGEELTGYGHARLMSKNLLRDLVVTDDQVHIQEKFLDVARGLPCVCEVRWRRIDGGVVHLEGASTPRFAPDGTFEGARCIFRDISDRRETENELIRLERLRSVGELAAGVSHNLNNLLAGVLLPADLARQKTSNPDVLHYLNAIELSAQRAADLVQRLYTSVRGEQEFQEAVDVNQIVKDVVETTRPRWKNEAEAQGLMIAMALDLDDVPKVRGSASGLHDVLTNFVFNAIDAMPRGGKLTISTRLLGDRVRLTVHDTGIGMDEETRRRVFEPFFTTKVDEGTGLGLATVYGTVTRWGGDVGVESRLGEGTTFFVDLPRWFETEDMVVVDQRVLPSITRQRILIVDDEAILCRTLYEILGRDHDVVTCEDGADALDLLQRESFDVVLIDLVLPEVRGDEIAQTLRRHDPYVVIVLMTGWHLDPGDDRLAHFDLYLKKPFGKGASEIWTAIVQAVDLRKQRLADD